MWTNNELETQCWQGTRVSHIVLLFKKQRRGIEREETPSNGGGITMGSTSHMKEILNKRENSFAGSRWAFFWLCTVLCLTQRGALAEYVITTLAWGGDPCSYSQCLWKAAKEWVETNKTNPQGSDILLASNQTVPYGSPHGVEKKRIPVWSPQNCPFATFLWQPDS